jgi:hypothetical protein
MSRDEIYDATRAWWRISLSRASQAQWAFAVHAGLVRAVFRIDRWEHPTAADIAAGPRRQGRIGFVGHRDVEMEKRYLGADVTPYLRSGAQNPVTYVNC